MANKQLILENAARDLSGGQFFDLIFVDAGAAYQLFLRDKAQPPTAPATVAQITAAGALPVIGGSGGGEVTGSGTTNKLMRWTDGAASVAGDSVLSEDGSGNLVQPTGNLTLTAGNLTLTAGNLVLTAGSISLPGSNAITSAAFLISWTVGATPGNAANLVAIAGSFTSFNLGNSNSHNIKIVLRDVTTLDGLVIRLGAADGQLRLSNALETGFDMIQLGGITSSFPAIQRSSAAVRIRLADNSADAALFASALTLGLTANAFLYSGTAGLLTATAAPTNGQLLIGSTGAAPVAAALTAGPGVTITNGAGSITIAANGGTGSVSPQASTPVAVGAGDSGTLYTNEGAAAQIVFNLPTAAANLRYTFIVQDADGIQVVASAGDTIRIAAGVSSVAGTATSTTIGSVIEIIAINATEWIAISSVGVWVLA